MPNPLYEKLGPVRRTRLNEEVVTRIKRLIYSKELKVGEKLPSERDLAARLKVSRVILREALRSLEQSGLVEIRPGLTGGAFVVYNLQKPLFDCVYDLFRGGSLTLSHFTEARRAIECCAIGRAVENATAESIEKLSQINESMVADFDRERFVAQNMAFHTTLADLSENPLLSLHGPGAVRPAEETAAGVRPEGKVHERNIQATQGPLSRRSGKKTFPFA